MALTLDHPILGTHLLMRKFGASYLEAETKQRTKHWNVDLGVPPLNFVSLAVSLCMRTGLTASRIFNENVDPPTP